MAGLTSQLINGLRFDFSSIKITVDGLIIDQITELSYESSLAPGIHRGTAAAKLGRSTGEYDSSGSITFSLEAFRLLQTKLALKGLALGGKGWMQVSFPIVVMYAELPTSPPIVDLIRGARITAVSDGHSQGGDVLARSCDIDIMETVYDGKPSVIEI